ncbi:hypothetical protein GFC29_619 [Anoxybacillus sp. B7M1]|nr:hypothetical protein GFC28_1008 [Anoxybacillus sp. B2M1]ANB65580.1 hypothetical protein GFC29_619 [Anoxybacillus sp. B7M1]
MTVQIKKCNLEDLRLLQEISIETFYDTFNTIPPRSLPPLNRVEVGEVHS